MQYLINAKQFIFFRVLAQVLFHTSKRVSAISQHRKTATISPFRVIFRIIKN